MDAGRRLTGLAAAALVLGGSITAAPATATAAVTAPAAASTTETSTSANRHVSYARVAASRQRATLRAITTAVRRSEYTGGVPADAYRVTGLRTSGSWAKATLVPRSTDELDPATVVLSKSRTGWKVVDLGTAGVGCDVAPAATLRALRLSCD